MSKHTPGPWRYWACRIDSSTGMEHYAQFANPKGHVFRAPLQYLSDADARLIAAAPDLLGALQELLGCDKTQTSFGAVMRARAAIAKATGAAA
jgi:hypothetical protein